MINQTDAYHASLAEARSKEDRLKLLILRHVENGVLKHEEASDILTQIQDVVSSHRLTIHCIYNG